MSFTVIIPARYGSTRMPGKPLIDLHGKPLVAHVVLRALESAAARVIVATDDQRIADAVSQYACDVSMTRDDHPSGSDRLVEVVTAESLADDEIVVNVQGDEPTIPSRLINEVAQKLADTNDAVMATAAQKIQSLEDFHNTNMVKVVINQQGKALYFSRAAIPHLRGSDRLPLAFHHIGIYAYRAGFLKRYSELKPSEIEKAESLEQLRVLDNGESIAVTTIDYDAGLGVDTPEDLERVRAAIQQAQAW